MMSRRELGKVVAAMTGTGGLPARRPDQLRSWTPPGVSPGSSNGIFRGRQVVIGGSGPGSGLFVYNGTPGLGNPPVFAITTSSVDPFGNVVTPDVITDATFPMLFYSGPAAANNLIGALTPVGGTDAFGNVYPGGFFLGGSGINGAYFKVDQNGVVYLFNAAGANIVRMNPTRQAIYLYNSSGGGAGNLIVSLASIAGTDPFGNTVPEGLQVTQGVISGTTFNGTDFIINTSGAFFYSGTPATGNLLVSIAPVAGTDGFGNAYVAGLGSYANSGNTLTQINGDNVGIGLASANALALFELFSELAMDGITITSGRALSGTTQAWIALLNSAYTSPNGSTPAIIVGQGPSGAGNTDTFSNHLFQVRGSQTTDTVFAWHPGSSRQTEETWQSLGTLAGATVNKGRYRLLPDGEVKVEIDITFAVATAVPITFANTLPSGYQVSGSVDVRAPMAQTNAAGGIGRIFVGSAGGANPGQVQFTTLGAGNAIGTYSAYFSYSII